MGRSELERLSREELIELVLRLQRPEKTSRTPSKPPSTDRKKQRERSKPGGAKPGHEGHSRVISEAPDAGRGAPSGPMLRLRSGAGCGPAGRDGQRARASRATCGEAPRHASSTPCGLLFGLRDAR